MYYPIKKALLCVKGDSTLSVSSWMFERKALQEYILLCCQNPGGGLLDKPGKWVQLFTSILMSFQIKGVILSGWFVPCECNEWELELLSFKGILITVHRRFLSGPEISTTRATV